MRILILLLLFQSLVFSADFQTRLSISLGPNMTFSKAEHPDQQRKLQGTARRDAVLRLGRQGGRAGRGKAREAEGSRPGCVKILLLYGPSKVADRGIGGG